MTTDQDQTEALQTRLRQAHADGCPVDIRGGGSKDFYGRPVNAEPLEVGGHRGIIDHEPGELVLTARAGTPLDEIRARLAEHGQMLPFEPPGFGPRATFGGTIATGLSGPRRPYAGAVRDAVLGVRILNGQGEVLRFGGQVMKNVAGYDVSRLMAGAQGTLGILLDISVKVLPRPAFTLTLTQAASVSRALESLQEWSLRPLPLSAACHVDDTLHIRLCGARQGVEQAAELIGGEMMDGADDFWRGIREQTHPFFHGDAPLWRVSVPPGAPMSGFPDACLVDWGGALRWFHGEVPASDIRALAEACGGHATLFRGHAGGRTEPFHPLTAPMLALQRRLKAAFDPRSILNPGRLYPEL